jgi:hypothetical protein
VDYKFKVNFKLKIIFGTKSELSKELKWTFFITSWSPSRNSLGEMDLDLIWECMFFPQLAQILVMHDMAVFCSISSPREKQLEEHVERRMA